MPKEGTMNRKKEPQKTERTFAVKEDYGKDGQAGKTFSKDKKTVPQYQCPVGCRDKVSFGEVSNCSNFRRISKPERRGGVKKYSLCRYASKA